jgi:TorA maturation chaperone TorD
MIFDTNNSERSEAYRVLADLFFKPPDHDLLMTVREDFELESKETEFEIVQDFNDLFLYPDGRVLPLESSFVRGSNIITVDEVTRFYADAGLTIEDEFQFMPDHISLEFLFMSYLIETGKTEIQEDFLDEHILNWVPAFCEEAAKHAKTKFYREITELASQFVSKEFQGYE